MRFESIFKRTAMDKENKPEEKIIREREQEKGVDKIGSIIKEAIDRHLPKIIELTKRALENKNEIMSEEDEENFRKFLMEKDNLIINKILETSDSFTEEDKLNEIADSLVEKEAEIREREKGGEKVSKTQRIKEMLRKVVPENSEGDGEYLDKAAFLLSQIEIKNKKAEIVLKALGGVLKNKHAQKEISERFREWLYRDEVDGNEDEIDTEGLEEIIKDSEPEKES